MTIIVGSRKQSCLITTNNKNLIIELYCYETNIINFNFFCLLFLFQLSHKKHEKNQWKCYVL